MEEVKLLAFLVELVALLWISASPFRLDSVKKLLSLCLPSSSLMSLLFQSRGEMWCLWSSGSQMSALPNLHTSSAFSEIRIVFSVS